MQLYCILPFPPFIQSPSILACSTGPIRLFFISTIFSFLLLLARPFTLHYFTMFSNTQSKGQFYIIDHQSPSDCKQNSPAFPHSFFFHLPSTRIRNTNPCNITVACTEPDTNSKADHRNASPLFLSFSYILQLASSMFKNFSTLFVTPIFIQNYCSSRSSPYWSFKILQVAWFAVGTIKLTHSKSP